MNRIYCLIFSLLVLFIVGYYPFDYELLFRVYSENAYYFIFFTVLIWSQLIFQNFNKLKIKSFFCKHKLALFISFFFIVFMFVSFSPNNKLLSDEINYTNFAKSMYEDHTVYNVCEEYSAFPDLKIRLSVNLGDKELLFPFFIYILHVFLGYSYNNVFILNFILSVLVLFSFYYFIYMHYGKKYGILSIFIVSSFPIFVHNVTSPSIEIANLFFILLIIILSYKLYITKQTFIAEINLYTCLLYINLKYNNIYILLVCLAYTIYILKKEIRLLSYRIYILLPLFIMPKLWLNTLLDFQENLNQQKIIFLYNNIKNMLSIIFGINDQHGWMIFPTFILLLMPLILIYKIINSKKNSNINKLNYYIYLFAISVIIFIESNFHKQLSLNYISRNCFVLLPFIIYAIIFSCKFLTTHTPFDAKKITIFILFIIIYNWSYGIRDKYIEKETIFFKINQILKYLKKQIPIKYEYLLVSPFPEYFIPHKYDSISIKRFNELSQKFIKHRKRNKGDQILIIQEIEQENIMSDSALSSEIQIQRIFETSISDTKAIRLSLVELR